MERHENWHLEQSSDIICVENHATPIRFLIRRWRCKKTFKATNQSVVKIHAWIFLVDVIQVFSQHFWLFWIILLCVDYCDPSFQCI